MQITCTVHILSLLLLLFCSHLSGARLPRSPSEDPRSLNDDSHKITLNLTSSINKDFLLKVNNSTENNQTKKNDKNSDTIVEKNADSSTKKEKIKEILENNEKSYDKRASRSNISSDMSDVSTDIDERNSPALFPDLVTTITPEEVTVSTQSVPSSHPKNIVYDESIRNCSYKETCAGTASNDWPSKRNCECDRACLLYGDCCMDAPIITSTIRQQWPALDAAITQPESFSTIQLHAVPTAGSDPRDAEHALDRVASKLRADSQHLFNSTTGQLTPEAIRTLQADFERRTAADQLSAELQRIITDQLLREAPLLRAQKQNFACVLAHGDIYVNMRTVCSTNSSANEQIRNACESAKPFGRLNGDDPMIELPVTSRKTGITYRNVYCALCNWHVLEKIHDELPSAQARVAPRGHRANQLNEAKDGSLSKSKKALNQEIPTDWRSQLLFWQTNVSCAETNKFLNAGMTKNELQQLITNGLRRDASLRLWLIEKQIGNRSLSSVCTLKAAAPLLSLRTCRPSAINQCSTDWPINEQRVRGLCGAYQALVYHNRVQYFNPHCAQCNRVPLNELTCSLEPVYNPDEDTEFGGFEGRSPGFMSSFAVLFDVNVAGSGGSNVVGERLMCASDQVYDPFRRLCRPLFCGGQVRCDFYSENILAENTSTTQQPPSIKNVGSACNQSTLFTPIPKTAAFIACAKIELHTDEYLLLKNDSIYLLQQEKLLAPGEFDFVSNQSYERVLVCAASHFTVSVDKFASPLDQLALIGLAMSTVCLALHLLVFASVAELRNLSGLNLCSMCVALLGAYLSILANQNAQLVALPYACIILSLLKYYCLLASFVWMSVIAFDVHRTIRGSVRHCKYAPGAQWTRFAIYSILAWTLPAIATCALYAAHVGQLPPMPEAINQLLQNIFVMETDVSLTGQLLGQLPHCWLGSRRALFGAFVAPVGALLLLNLVLFTATSSSLYETRRQTRAHALHPNSATLDFALYARLALLMGLGWLFGLLGALLEAPSLWIAFNVCISLQGVFILLAFSWKRTVIRKLRARLHPAHSINGEEGQKTLTFLRWICCAGESQMGEESSTPPTQTSQPSNDSKFEVHSPSWPDCDQKTTHKLPSFSQVDFSKLSRLAASADHLQLPLSSTSPWNSPVPATGTLLSTAAPLLNSVPLSRSFGDLCSSTNRSVVRDSLNRSTNELFERVIHDSPARFQQPLLSNLTTPFAFPVKKWYKRDKQIEKNEERSFEDI